MPAIPSIFRSWWDADEALAATDNKSRESATRIGILGSGLMGGALGTNFGRAGHEIAFSYARSAQKLAGLAREAGRNARFGTPREAARDAHALILAVHWLRFDDILEQAGDMSGKVIITCSPPMSEDNTELVFGRISSAAEQLAKKVPKARFVSAFNTVPSEVLFGVYAAKRRRQRPSLVYCGNHARSKEVAAQLIRDSDFEPLDAVPLRTGRYTEPFALLVGRIAYEGQEGPEVAYRFDWFATR